MSVFVVNFQITPYSDEDSDYVNNLSKEEIYHLFASDVGSAILTVALYAIIKLEPQNISKLCSNDVKLLENVYLQDALLFSENINDMAISPHVFVLIENGRYAGHSYAWNINTVTNVIGMRSSADAILANKCGLRQNSIVSIFLNSIQEWIPLQKKVQAVEGNNDRYLRVLQPCKCTARLLARCGFVLAKTIRNEPGLGWLFNNGSLGDIAIVKPLIFREYDYIISAFDALQCS